MNILKRVVLSSIALVALSACDSHIDESRPMAPEAVSEVGFALTTDATRTTLADDGMTTRWAEGDKLAVWAMDAEGGFAFENCEFRMRYFSAEFDKAYFVSSIEPMADGEYTYMLSYPTPKAVEGTRATYTLPAVQSGVYDGSYDVMVAESVVAGELNKDEKTELNTLMHHQMHALKITIPEKSGNFTDRVYGLNITFPRGVVGDMTVDVANPTAEPTLSNMSNTITVWNDEGFAVGSDIWVFVLPGTVSGSVSYRIEGAEQRSEVAVYNLERDMQRGHVTPIRMGMPSFDKYTAFNFSIGENYLGEDFNFFTLYDSNGTNMGTFNRNSENRYTWEHHGEFDVTPYNNSTWTLVFDTESAVVENRVNMGTLRPYYKQDITPVDVPYLLFQDFNSASEDESYGNNDYKSEDRDQPGKALSGVLSGWNAARFWLKPGAMRLNARRQCVEIWVILTTLKFTSSHHGRMDTPPLWNGTRGIKPGKSVNVNLQFDAAMNRHSSSSLKVTQAGISVSTHTNANNPIDGIPTGATGVNESYSTTLADYGPAWCELVLSETAGSDDFGKRFPTYSTEFAVSSTTRICFYPTINCEDSGIGNSEINVYIDNIKVSIAKE